MHTNYRQTLIYTMICLLLFIGNPLKTQAAIVVTAAEIDGDVVFSTMEGGSLDLSGLTYSNTLLSRNGISPAGRVLLLGGYTDVLSDIYTGASQPDSFGMNFSIEGPSSSTGSRVGVSFDTDGGVLVVPTGYVSNDPLSATLTYSGETFLSLNLFPGTYIWSWSSDSLTLNIPSAVPVPASIWLFISALGLLGGFGRKSRNKTLQPTPKIGADEL